MDSRVVTWNINVLFVATSYDRGPYRGKLRMLRALVDTNDVATLQDTHGHVADLGELLKMFPDCLGMGTVADSRNVGGTIVLLRRSFVAEVVSVVSHRLEGGKSLRAMIDFSFGSLDLLAIRSDPAQACTGRGLASQLVAASARMHGESARALAVAMGNFKVTMPGDCRYDVLEVGRDYSKALSALGSRSVSVTSVRSRARATVVLGDGRAGTVFNLPLTTLCATFCQSISPTSSRLRARGGGPWAPTRCQITCLC